MKTDKLQLQLEHYKNLRTDEERKAFLQAQRDRIAQMSPEEAKAELAAIAQKVNEIEQRVSEAINPNAA